MHRSPRTAVAAILVSLTLLVPGSGQAEEVSGKTAAPARRGGGKVRILVLSNRADLISGDDAYVELRLPRRVHLRRLRVRLGKRNVKSAFVHEGGRILGVVDGLKAGRNRLRAWFKAGPGARITITNHPIGGPVFAGPQVQPWICATEANGLGAAKDEQCNTDPVYTFEYKSSSTGQFTAYDPDSPPPASEIASTTTDEGVTVPYIVRRERGVIDRGIYDIAVLFDPEQDWKPWAPQDAWNHKLLVPGGSGCDPGHKQVAPPSVMDDQALSRGFAVVGAAMSDNTQNCNDVVQAESLMMVKEHLVETYGEIRYAIGVGGSGGSMFQHSVAANYPGLLDGIQPSASFPDIWTTFTEMADCKLLSHYFNETSPHLWTEQQRAWASGHASAGTCEFEGQARANSYVHATGNTPGPCGGNDWTYEPQSNPDGARCGLQDYQVSTFGRRPTDAWNDIERSIGTGFANRPYDTVGIQWGLKALEAGQILPEQFVDLNEKIGGLDIDGNLSPDRSVADPFALETIYRSGRLSNGRELAKIPIFDLRGTSNFEEHYDWHSLVLRNRLIRDNGDADNHVYWKSSCPLLPCPPISEESFLLIDKWLAAIEADTSKAPLEVKVVRNKPAEAADACWLGPNNKVTDPGTCDTALPHFSDSRTTAGAPPTMDVVKCQLKPLVAEDYGVSFTPVQWTRLQETFPTGVCDYSKPGVEQQAPAGPWMTFANGPGGVPLGPPPHSKPIH